MTATVFLANLAWPGTTVAFGVMAIPIVGLGLLFEWAVVARVFGLRPGRAALAAFIMNAVSMAVGVPLAYTIGGMLAEEPVGAIGFLVLLSFLSAAIEAATLARWFGVPASGRTFAWLVATNLVSCAVLIGAIVVVWALMR